VHVLHANIVITLIANSGTLLGKLFVSFFCHRKGRHSTCLNDDIFLITSGDIRGTGELLKPLVEDISAAVLEQ
jgi:hypothetical protein